MDDLPRAVTRDEFIRSRIEEDVGDIMKNYRITVSSDEFVPDENIPATPFVIGLWLEFFGFVKGSSYSSLVASLLKEALASQAVIENPYCVCVESPTPFCSENRIYVSSDRQHAASVAGVLEGLRTLLLEAVGASRSPSEIAYDASSIIPSLIVVLHAYGTDSIEAAKARIPVLNRADAHYICQRPQNGGIDSMEVRVMSGVDGVKFLEFALNVRVVDGKLVAEPIESPETPSA